MSGMAPDSYTQAEIVRLLQAMHARLGKIEDRLQDHYLPRGEWDAWKVQIGTDVVNLEAEQARIRRDLREEVEKIRVDQRSSARWALGFAVSAFGVAVAATGFLMNALGLGA